MTDFTSYEESSVKSEEGLTKLKLICHVSSQVQSRGHLNPRSLLITKSPLKPLSHGEISSCNLSRNRLISSDVKRSKIMKSNVVHYLCEPCLY